MVGKYPVYLQGYMYNGQSTFIAHADKFKGGLGIGVWSVPEIGFPPFYIGGQLPQGITDAAHANGVPIYDIIGIWPLEQTDPFFANPSGWTATINNLVGVVQTYGYDGICVDIESMSPSSRFAFSDFCDQLADALHAVNKKCVVSIGWKNADWMGEQWCSQYDYTTLGQTDVDEFQIMDYWVDDWHVTECLGYALTRIPKEKINYGVFWTGYDSPLGRQTTLDEISHKLDLIYNTYHIDKVSYGGIGMAYMEPVGFWDLIIPPKPGVCIEITTKAAPAPISPILAAALIGAGGLVIMRGGK